MTPMKMIGTLGRSLGATALASLASNAGAQTISASSTIASTHTAFPPGHVATVTLDRQGQTVNGFLFELEYNAAHLSLGAQHTDPDVAHPRVSTVGTGGVDFGCVELVVGTLRCLTSAPITSATFRVDVAFGVLGVVANSPLSFDQAETNFVNAAFSDAPFSAISNGAVNIPTPGLGGMALTFAPASGTILGGSNISITPSAGQAGAVATYSCTPPAGVTVTNQAGTIVFGGAAVTMNVSCPAGTPDGAMACTHTGLPPGTPSPVIYTVDCPAPGGGGFVMSASPPPGALACNGPAGSTQTTAITFTNNSNFDATGFACIVNGAGFALQTAPSATIPGGTTTTAVIACAVPAGGTPAVSGMVTCQGGVAGTGPFAYAIWSQAQNQGGLTQAAIVPASSLWSKVGLVGLLAVLGMLVVGFRRK